MDEQLNKWIEQLEAARDKYQDEYNRLSEAVEAARRLCVPVQQRLEKLKDALASLRHAREWDTEEVPL